MPDVVSLFRLEKELAPFQLFDFYFQTLPVAFEE